jgi:hypothetical protein
VQSNFKIQLITPTVMQTVCWPTDSLGEMDSPILCGKLKECKREKENLAQQRKTAEN